TTMTRIQQNHITMRWAHTGIFLTLLLGGIGVLCLMAAVAEFAGQWNQVFRLSEHLYGIQCALLGLVDLRLAILTWGLAIQCPAYAAYGEAVASFEEIQAVPQEDRERIERRFNQVIKIVLRWMLGFGLVFGLASYLDGYFITGSLAGSWNEGILQ